MMRIVYMAVLIVVCGAAPRDSAAPGSSPPAATEHGTHVGRALPQ